MSKGRLCLLILMTITTLSIRGCKGNDKMDVSDHSNVAIDNKNNEVESEIVDGEVAESHEKKEEEIDKKDNKENNQNNEKPQQEKVEKEELVEKEVEKDVEKPENQENLVDNTKTAWWFIRNKEHKTPKINENLKYNLKDYDAYYVGDVDKKVLYLTFDEGYENGYTSQILDVLKRNEVKATFFVTLPYVKERPDLVKRMEAEGHVVGNHTKSHLSMPDVTSHVEKFENELKSVEAKYKEVTGKDMAKYFRPPMGEYSQKSLAMTKDLGYKTIFWSFAYRDWEPTEQFQPEEAKKLILDGMHNGAIFLLHAVSKTNAEILEEIITESKNQGYEFELLP